LGYKRRVRITALWMVVATGVAMAAPPKPKAGEWPKLRHIVDAPPKWAAACGLSLTDVVTGGYMLDVECKGGLEEIMFSRETSPGTVAELAGTVAGLWKATTEPVELDLGDRKAKGLAIVDRDGKRAFGMVVQAPKRGDKTTDTYLCWDAKPAPDRLARCKEVLSSLARSSAIRGKAALDELFP
jgi:hypothetical protein